MAHYSPLYMQLSAQRITRISFSFTNIFEPSHNLTRCISSGPTTLPILLSFSPIDKKVSLKESIPCFSSFFTHIASVISKKYAQIVQAPQFEKLALEGSSSHYRDRFQAVLGGYKQTRHGTEPGRTRAQISSFELSSELAQFDNIEPKGGSI